MSKYSIYFILIAIVTLQYSIIYGRQHSSDTDASKDTQLAKYFMNYIRSQSYNNRQLYHPQTRIRKHNAKMRSIRSWQENVPPDTITNAEENKQREEAAEALRRYIHIQRHIARQQQHLIHHKEEYHQNSEQMESEFDEVQSQEQVEKKSKIPFSMSMPRIWQLLGSLQAADAPIDYSGESQRTNTRAESVDLDDLLPPTPEAISNSLSENEATYEDHQLKTATTGCPKCESSRRMEHITEEELTQLRIEYVKQQILEKLRLKERPNVSAIGLPKPIYEGTTIDEEEDGNKKNKDVDDYYARTSKKFIFLQREKRECQHLETNSSMCFSFKIDDADADGFDVSTAVLWLFKSRTKRSNRNGTQLVPQTIVVSEVHQNTDPRFIPMVKTIAIQSIDVQDEWMKIDIEWPIKRWFGNHDLSHLIHISCHTCDMVSMERMISLNKDYRPFIMVDTQNRRRASRQKRGINCTHGVTECCREKLYISFDEIGWGDWIIQPRGYDAYFCRGSCGSVASVTQSATHHSTFLQKVALSRRNLGSKPLELIPCCTAKQYSSLQLVFIDSNNTATQKTFPNMVIESCGCR